MSPAGETPQSPATPYRESVSRSTDVGRAPGADQSRLNWPLAAMLFVLVALVPIPLGGNRPVVWMAAAASVGLLGCWYGTALLFKRAVPRLPLERYWPEALGMIVFMLFGAMQVIPLGRALPIVFQLPEGSLDASYLSLTPGDSWLTLIGFATFGLFALLMLQVAANRRRARLLLACLFAILVGHALFALVNLHYLGDTVLGLPKNQYEGFATGTFVNRNSFATFVAAGLSIGVAILFDLVYRERERSDPTLWVTIPATVLGLVFCAGALLSTGSRMGAISGAIGVGLVAILAIVSAGGRRRATWAVAGALLVVLIAVVIAYGSGTMDRLASLDSSGEGRAELYPEVVEAIMARPLLGYGGGSFIMAFPAFQHAPLSGDLVWNKAHSTYLALWFEYGLVFGTIPMLVVLGLVVRAMSGLFSASSRSLALASLGVAVTFAIHSIVDFSLEIQGNVYLMLAVLALGAAHMRPTRGSAKQE